MENYNPKLSQNVKQIVPKLAMTVAALLSFLPASAYDFMADGICYNITDAAKREVEVAQGTSPYPGNIDIPSTVINNEGTSYSVTAIGDYAFSGCYHLTNITIPNSVTSIGDEAFCDCSSLTSITIPTSVTSIGDKVFYRCQGLTSVTIPNSVTSIGDWAFQVCTGLTSVTIPSSVTSIGDGPFAYCTVLIAINVDTGNKSYTSVDGVLYNKNLTGIIQYPAGKPGTTFSIPSSVTSIGGGAFYYCTGLTSVAIPNSVTTIGDYAFDGCSGLTSITIPSSVTSIGDYAFAHCYGSTSITIPNSVTSIEDGAFNGCEGLTSITIPNSVTSIGKKAFQYCHGLTSLTIPNSVTAIGDYAFSDCSGLTSVSLGNSVTSIGDRAFGYCEGLTSITIPNSVTSIGNEAFYYCPLKSVYCNWNEPLECDKSLFSSDCYESGILYVPKGCVNKYSSTSPWLFFGKIEETDNLGVEDILDDQLTGEYVIYDLQGVLRLKTENIDEVKQLPAGLYIVNGKKIIIR